MHYKQWKPVSIRVLFERRKIHISMKMNLAKKTINKVHTFI